MKRVVFTNEEFQGLVNLIDVAVKALGLASARPASAVLSRLEAVEDWDPPAPLAEATATPDQPQATPVSKPKPKRKR